MDTHKKELFITHLIIADLVMNAFRKYRGCTEAEAEAAFMKNVLCTDVPDDNPTKAMIGLAMEGKLPAMQMNENPIHTALRPFLDVVETSSDIEEEQWYLDICSKELPKIVSMLPMEYMEELAEQLANGVRARFNQYVDQRGEINGILEKMTASVEKRVSTKPHLVEYLGLTNADMDYPVLEYAPSVSSAIVDGMFEELRMDPQLADIRKLCLSYPEHGYAIEGLQPIVLETTVVTDLLNQVSEEVEHVPESVGRLVLRVLTNPDQVTKIMERYCGEYDVESLIELNTVVRYFKPVLESLVSAIDAGNHADLTATSNLQKARRVELTLSALLRLLRTNVFAGTVLFENDMLNADLVPTLEKQGISKEAVFQYKVVHGKAAKIVYLNALQRELQDNKLTEVFERRMLRMRVECESDLAEIQIDELSPLVSMYTIDDEAPLKVDHVKDFLKQEYAVGLSVEDATYKLVFDRAPKCKLAKHMHQVLNRRAMELAKEGVEFDSETLKLMDDYAILKTMAAVAFKTLIVSC